MPTETSAMAPPSPSNRPTAAASGRPPGPTGTSAPATTTSTRSRNELALTALQMHSPRPHLRLTPPAPPPRRRPGFAQGFTLTELLVVIGIIVLIATLAIPAFSVITGNRSVDSAQNQLQAVI